MLDQSSLVLESVALAQVVELVVQMLVDLARRPVFHQQPPEDTQTPHPHDLTIGGTTRQSNISQSLSKASNVLSTPSYCCSRKRRLRNYIRRHSSISCTLPLPKSPMSPDPPRSSELSGTGTRVHSDLLADDEAIGNKLADGLT